MKAPAPVPSYSSVEGIEEDNDEILEPINEWKSRLSKYNKKDQNQSSNEAEGEQGHVDKEEVDAINEDILCSQKSEDDALDLNQDEANVEDVLKNVSFLQPNESQIQTPIDETKGEKTEQENEDEDEDGVVF
ncbi:hypothetical protein R6Q57_023510 [Mikania cordata]